MPTQTLVLGAVYERDDINEPISADVHVSSGYAELQSQFGEHWYSAANVRYDDNSRFGSKVTYRLAPTWVNADTDTKLKASVGTGFKAPTLSELYQDFPALLLRQPQPAARDQHRLGRRHRAGLRAGCLARGRDVLPHQHQQPDHDRSR